MAWTSGQRYVAEFVGTMGLLLAVGGAAVFTLTGGTDPLTRVAVISLSVGFGLIGLIYAFGDISGAHFNPAVTVGAAVAGRFPAGQVVPYILAQVAGGVTGMGIIAAIAYGGPSGTFSIDQSNALASQGYGSSHGGYSLGSVLLIEVAFTFLLVIAVLFATRPESPEKKLAPLGIGLTLVMTNLVAIPIDGASINPARSFAPAVLSAAWSSGNWAIGLDWVFWVGPILGGVLAALVDRALREYAPGPPTEPR